MVVDVGVVKNHLKPKADSTLCNMRKADLIEYIRTLEHNYNVAVSFNENQAKYIESLGVLPKWIPVTEKMPPDWISVLIVTPGEHPLPLVHEAYHASNCWATRCVVYNDDEITHWMPLPEPPKEK